MKGMTMRRRAVGFVTAFAALAMLVVSSTPSPATGADGSGGYLTFKDPGQGSSWSIGLAAAGADRGRFQFGVTGAGLIWPDGRATVDVKSDHSVIVTYDGAGFADRQATIDPDFAIHQGSGNEEPVHLRLQAQVNPDRVTASAELWVDGIQYKLTDKRPTTTANADLDAIIGFLEAEAWADYHRTLYAGAREQMTEAAFVEAIAAEYATVDGIAEIDRTGPISYNAPGSGFDIATAPLRMQTGAGTVFTGRASLIWEGNRWAVLSIDSDE